MAEQVKSEGISTHSTNALSNKSEKNGTKSRGSGSPFKCIGLGLAQQIKHEKVEELSASRMRIEELESQAACQQKEVGISLQLHISHVNCIFSMFPLFPCPDIFIESQIGSC